MSWHSSLQAFPWRFSGWEQLGFAAPCGELLRGNWALRLPSVSGGPQPQASGPADLYQSGLQKRMYRQRQPNPPRDGPPATSLLRGQVPKL